MTLDEAVSALLAGECVILPTETVYGLAANALDPVAVARIFAAKGRPSGHPLIVHVADLDSVHRVAFADARTTKLASAFWPGPLTLVLPKRPEVPPAVSGGRETVGVRIPAHPIFREVLNRTRLSLAAPSANRFTRLSPTRFEDIDPTLEVAGALDGGDCEVGLESTVLDLTQDEPVILRPGMISANLIAALLGLSHIETRAEAGKSPGTHARHYQPRAKVHLTDRLAPDQVGLALHPTASHQRTMPLDAEAYAQALYRTLAEMDRWGHKEIWIERPPATPGWEAIHDRLRRAASDG